MAFSPSRMAAFKGGPVPIEKRHPDDFYATQFWVTRGLLSVEKFEGDIWEPACGNLDMAYVLTSECLGDVWVSDITPRRPPSLKQDFLATKGLYGDAPNIVTNPPFRLFNEFAMHALSLKPEKLALLAPLSFLHSKARWDGIFSRHPPARVWTFVERPAFVRGGRAPEDARGVQEYAWAVWEKKPPRGGMFRGGWIPPME